MEDVIGGIIAGVLASFFFWFICLDSAYKHDIHACMAQHLSVERCNEISQWGVK